MERQKKQKWTKKKSSRNIGTEKRQAKNEVCTAIQTQKIKFTGGKERGSGHIITGFIITTH